MIRQRTLHAVEVDHQPVLMTSYAFEPKEQEIVDLTTEVAADTGLPSKQSALLAMSALPQPDVTFVEYLTCGALTLDADGALSGDPAVLAWLDGIRKGAAIL